MKNNKKMLALAVFILMMNGCAVYHTNVVKDVAIDRMLIEDVESHLERVLMVHDTKYQKTMLSYLQSGDTVWIKSPMYAAPVLEPDIRTVICFDSDSVEARMQRRQLEFEKQAARSGKTR